MGIVTQESILFNDTVYNNITFGMENVSREKVVEAARIANALEFIEQLPKKFETNIGDRGENLSGGQRQRIAIARARSSSFALPGWSWPTPGSSCWTRQPPPSTPVPRRSSSAAWIS